MLTWEYPPANVGGLGNHVYQLSKFLAERSVYVDVVTVGADGAQPEENFGKVTVHRVQQVPVQVPDFLTWVMQLNMALAEKAMQLGAEHGYDLVHAHDWLVAYAARQLKAVFGLPLVATIHATEAGRNQGIHNPQQQFINSVEWWLTYEAWRVIVCSRHMFNEVTGQFKLPEDKVDIIANGVDPEEYRSGAKRLKREQLIFFVGRLVREKGAQVLLGAMPEILSQFPEARLVIAGKGPMQDELVSIAHRLGIAGRVEFPGFINDETRNNYYRRAAAAVFPSLYEPFGIVALEGMAAETPVVVSDTGGLGEIVTHGVNGMKALPGNAGSLAGNIIMLLRNEQLAQKITLNASRLIKEKYDWRVIAGDTKEIYRQVLENQRQVSAAVAERVNSEVDGYQLRSSLAAQRLKFRREV